MLSLGVLYVFAVLPIAIVWGLAYAVGVSVASMLAFNFFFLPPLAHASRSATRGTGLRSLVFVVTAIVVSELGRAGAPAGARSLAARGDRDLAARARQRQRRARSDLRRGGAGPPGRARARSTLGEARCGTAGEAHELTRRRTPGRDDPARGRQRGERGARRRLLPALASLLGVAIDRERLAQEAFEAEALRRADVIKTALLRAVSHDLRTPLMAISTSAGALARPDLAIDDADRAELLATILEASDRLDRLVGNLLDLSRLQAGAAQPRAASYRARRARRRRRSTSSASRRTASR